MKILIIGLVLLIIGGILFPLFTYLRAVKKEGDKVSKRKKNSSNASDDDLEDIDVEGADYVGTTQELLDFEEIEICNDKMALLRINEYEYVAYLEVKGVAYNLLSEEERYSLEENYGNLLNGVDFEFQQYIQSRSLNLDIYVDRYREKVEKLKFRVDNLEKKLINAKTLQDKNTLSIQLNKANNQLEYGLKLLEDFEIKNIDSRLLERKYYIVLKYFFDSDDFDYELSHKEIVEEAFNDLSTKASIFIDTLNRNNLECNFLNGIQIGELLYNAYNKEDANILKLENLIKAQYNHLATSSRSVYEKSINNELKALEEEQKKLEKKIIEDEEIINKYSNEEGGEN